MSASKEIPIENTELQNTEKATPTKFILPLEDTCENQNQSAGHKKNGESFETEVSNFCSHE